MPTMADVSIEAQVTMLKGEPGTRKSTQALSYPLPHFWISTDQKMQALTLPMKRWGIPAKEVHFEDYSNWDKVRAKLEQLQVNCPYKTIMVDSVTSMGDAMTRQVKKLKNMDGSGKKIGNIPTSGLEEFNAESNAFQEMIALLQDIHTYHKVNIVLMAHVIGQRKSDDANKSTHHSRIIITGAEKISGKLASYMTEVYHFNVQSEFDADSGNGQYGLFTTHTGNDYARTSLPLPRQIIFNNDPLYEKWIAPAIAQLKAEAPIQRIGSQPQPPTTQPPNVTPFVK